MTIPISRYATLSLVVGLSCASAAQAEELRPPQALVKVEPRLAPGVVPPVDRVVLEFTVTLEGRASEATVVDAAGEPFDRLALEALEAWTFEPASQDGHPVPTRVRAVMHLRPVPFEVDAGAPDAGVPDAGPAEFKTTVTGRALPRSRGAGDFHAEVGELQTVPRSSSAELLKLAPGLMLSNEGGEGHAEQIFLRGFDAREGQDLELSVDGVPVNQSGNLHGNGYADLNFVIPELVQAVRVVEGPFDPRQGNYAVAGSADYELGLERRGLTVRLSYGSFDTERLVALFGTPGTSERSFAGVQLSRTGGFGQNRSAQNAKMMGQWELRLENGAVIHLAANGYATQYKSAGLLRADDVAAGRVGFSDTYDSRQGGDALRGSVSADFEYREGAFTQKHQLYAVTQSMRLLEDFTGFIEDPQQPYQPAHQQRGDLIDQLDASTTVGARGFGRYKAPFLDRIQSLEVGYFARLDFTDGVQTRLRDGTDIPYHTDLSLSSRLADLGLYVDLDLSPWWWLQLRGGVRADLLTYDLLDRCAQQTVEHASKSDPPLDQSCLSQSNFGAYREPTQTTSAVGTVLLPRVTVALGPWRGASLTGSVGNGVRSVDPQFVSNDTRTPFASIFGWEGGATWAVNAPWPISARAIVFGTHVDRDLIFSEQAGRSIIGGGTTRLGALAALRMSNSFLDLNASATWVRSTFDDTGLLVPYVPDLVVRADAAFFHQLPWALLGTSPVARGGLGVDFIGRRALPYGQRSDARVLVDASAQVEWKALFVGLAVRNLLDTQYRLGEYDYTSDFHTQGALPTLVPARMFSAGAPRSLLLTVGITLGGAPK